MKINHMLSTERKFRRTKTKTKTKTREKNFKSRKKWISLCTILKKIHHVQKSCTMQEL